MPDGDPILVEVVRSGFVESAHHGAVVVVGSEGEVRSAIGDVERPRFPRSANKPMQAAGMLAEGLAADEGDLSLTCASHNGEQGHIERVLALLASAGLHERDLRCPADYPLHEPSKFEAIREGIGRSRAAMNCSGKHAGMLLTCVERGWPTESYLEREHPLQQALASRVAELTGEPVAATGVDGCGAPLFGFSLIGLARAFSALVTAREGERRRVADAMRAHPWLVAGTGRIDTLLMTSVPGLLSKEGAEGVAAFALPDGTALACKVGDGAGRAKGPVLVAALAALGALPGNPAAASVLTGVGRGAGLVLGGGREAGELRVTEACRAALTG
ncbi:asparaginase [Prauserella marina]|uniref:Asparaginase n=1 Tax=Prauserella marina TaxID=530584 RepID=A0A222VXQ5_9PSEU|nr:asparaginase [Prauserella marina]ASR38602.1 asparaginase [Prauserella marina]PWV81924.1 asparaginase [Prauserella marina]SDD15446.1 asparaginase [Prauserella marina]